MPWIVVKRKPPRPWKILKHGKEVGSSNSKAEAEASVRAREAAVHGEKMK